MVIDPLRCMRVLGLGEESGFSKKVTYIYRKQLEEADILVVNKADLIDAEQERQLQTALGREFHGKQILTVSARTGQGLETWFDTVLSGEQSGGNTMDLDYRIYAEGEALLGWLNATVALTAVREVDGDRLLATLADRVALVLAEQGIEIAHFKMTLSPEDGSNELAVLNLVGSARQPELSQSLSDPLDHGQLIVNLRAEGEPDQLSQALMMGLEAINDSDLGVRLERDHHESFKPGEPQPIYRMNHHEEPIAVAEEGS